MQPVPSAEIDELLAASAQESAVGANASESGEVR
jgi:hypothetical protein